MPVPAHRHNKSKVRRRRSHDALQIVKPNLCSKCGQAKLSHIACPACGFYKGRQVIKTKEDVILKRTEKRKKMEAKQKEKMQSLKNK